MYTYQKNIYTIILILRSIKLHLIKVNWAFYWLSLEKREKAQSFNTKTSSGSLYLFEGIREICSSHLIEEAHLSKAPDSNSSFYFIILIYRGLKVRPFFVVFFTFFAMRCFFHYLANCQWHFAVDFLFFFIFISFTKYCLKAYYNPKQKFSVNKLLANSWVFLYLFFFLCFC